MFKYPPLNVREMKDKPVFFNVKIIYFKGQKI